MHLVVGLGNPGRRYAQTRHNLGFMVIDALAARHRIAVQASVGEAWCGQGTIAGQPVLLAKPQTYMNASGKAVVTLAHAYLREGEKLIVVHDDIDLPLGKIRLKRGGGDAGHLGVRSVIACLGHGDFFRVRLGIGRPPRKEEVVDYVLSPFAPAEIEARDAMIAQAVDLVERLLAADTG
ncbi:MAG: peptidyl-tRNA hydrolase [Candidatus Tectimicrobiota bacterium]|nr:MAG: peptidyl-tRNA hydrolase [Candidatus Tectomicrobia bacterium]